MADEIIIDLQEIVEESGVKVTREVQINYNRMMAKMEKHIKLWLKQLKNNETRAQARENYLIAHTYYEEALQYLYENSI